MAKKERSTVPAEKLAIYDKLIAGYDDIERKGAKMPYTSKNGNMFSFFDATDTFCVRLSKEEQEKFFKEFPGTECFQYGKQMNGYVSVPEEYLFNTRKIKRLFKLSYEFVSSLEPKPTTKKKK